jgi:hypothetical protein
VDGDELQEMVQELLGDVRAPWPGATLSFLAENGSNASMISVQTPK